MNKHLAGFLEKIRFRLNSVEHNGQRVETRSEKQGAIRVHTPIKKYKPVNGTLSAWFEKNPQAREVVPAKSQARPVVQVPTEKKRVAVVAPPSPSPKPRHSKGLKETMIDAPETDVEFIEALHALASEMSKQAETVNEFFETIVSAGIASEATEPLETVAETLIEASQAADEVVSRFMAHYESVIALAAAGELPGGNTFFTGEVE